MMYAGYGKAEITPPLGVELAGYGYYLQRRAVAVKDPLYARAVMLRDDHMKCLIISCDLLGVSEDVCRAVEDAALPFGVTPDHIMLVSVHTHTGPVIKDHEGCGVPDEAYIASLPGKIAQAIRAAHEDMGQVTRLSYYEKTPPALITESPVNKAEMKHGFAVPGAGSGLTYNRAIQDGPVDRTIRGFIIDRQDKKPIALASGACHAVFNRVIPQISADYPGVVNGLLSDAGYESIYLNGLCGDIDPAEKSPQRMDEYAHQIASVFSEGGRELPLTLSADCRTFMLRLVTMSREERHAAVQAAVEKAGGPHEKAARPALVWEENMLKNEGDIIPSERAICHIIALGGIPICSVPFEGYTAIGQKAREIAHCPQALVLGCQGEMKGYLPTVDDIQAGGYAALESTFLYRRLPVKPGEAERLGLFLGEVMSDHTP